MFRRVLAVAFFLALIVPDMMGWEVSFGPGLSIKNAFLYLLFIGLALQIALEGRLQKIELPSVHIIFLLLISYAVFMWLIASLIIGYRNYSMMAGLIALKSLLVDNYLVFLVYFYLLRTRTEALWVLKNILWIVAVVNVLVVVDSYGVVTLGIVNQDEVGRAEGVLSDSHTGSNEYARLIILFLPALFVSMISAAGFNRLMYLGAICVTLMAMLFTTSRGALIGLAAGMIVAGVYLRGVVSVKNIAVIGVIITSTLIMMVGIVSVQFPELFVSRFLENTGGGSAESMTSHRNVIWATALAKQAEEPYTFVTGYGWNVYGSMGFRYSPHNHYLAYLFNLGLIGVALFCALCAEIVRSARQAVELCDEIDKYYLVAFVIGFISVLIAVFFSEIFKVWLFVWAYAGIAMRLSVIALDAPTAKPAAAKVIGRLINSSRPQVQ